jgi:hypothetical protein
MGARRIAEEHGLPLALRRVEGLGQAARAVREGIGDGHACAAQVQQQLRLIEDGRAVAPPGPIDLEHVPTARAVHRVDFIDAAAPQPAADRTAELVGLARQIRQVHGRENRRRDRTGCRWRCHRETSLLRILATILGERSFGGSWSTMR